MLVEFQYADDALDWVGYPHDAHRSPNPRPKRSGWVYEPNTEGFGGVVRMWAITDDGRRTEFVYDDFYYWYQAPSKLWVFGSGTPKREFILYPDHTEAIERAVLLPDNASIRYGVTLSPEDAVRFSLIKSVNEKTLHPKASIPIERRSS